MEGINGATVLSVFQASLVGSFLIPRTVPATAVLFSEPIILPTARQSQKIRQHHSCPRPIIRIDETLKTVQTKISPLTAIYSRVTNRISRITSKISSIKSSIVERLRLTCLFPRILQPFVPFLQYTRCKLGFDEDGFMDTPPCNLTSCLDPRIQDQPITRDRGIPNFDFMMDGRVSTLDECFSRMEKITYGTRIIAKLVEDEPCDVPKYNEVCEEAIQNNRIVFEESCETPK